MNKEKKEDITSVKAEKPETKAVNVVYIGPSIPGIVRHGTVYKDGVLTDKLNECIADFPAMQRLFVSVDEAPAAIKEKNKTQSAIRSICELVLAKYVK